MCIEKIEKKNEELPDNKLSGKTKVCKCCGKGKPVEEFQSKGNNKYDSQCKLCRWFEKRPNLQIQKGWTFEEYKIILDNLLNKKINCVNEIVSKLNNKNLEELILLLKKLKLKGMKIGIKFKCGNINCNKEKIIKLNNYLKNKNHFCSLECKSETQKNAYNNKNGFIKCKSCYKEKPLNEFHMNGKNRDGEKKYRSKCKVCSWFDNHKDKKIKSDWNMNEYRIIIDSLLNNKVKNINEILPKLNNKDLQQLITIIQYLNIYGTNIKIKYFCDYCGKENTTNIFPYLLHKTHFCGKECFDKFQNTSILTTCNNCNKKIEIQQGLMKKYQYHFCCNECRIEYDKKFNITNKKNAETIKYNCDWCGKEILIKDYIFKDTKNHFCDVECYKNWQKNKTEKECKICGEIKPIDEFNNKSNTCRVCNWFKNNENLKIKEGWTKTEYKIIIDNIINRKTECINDFLEQLQNKTLKDLSCLIKNDLKLKNYTIRIKVFCKVCNKEMLIPIAKFLKQNNFLCSKECIVTYKRNDFDCQEGYSKCGICGKEKPYEEFVKAIKNGKQGYFKCKVCDFLKRNSKLTIQDRWSIEEYTIIIDNILNQKTKCINDIIPLLNNKTLDCLANLLSKDLKIQKEINIRVQCQYCSKTIYKKLNEYLNDAQKNYFCSTQCSSKYYGEKRTENKQWFKRICKQCGKEYYIDISDINNGKRLKFCSPECSQKSQINRIEYNCDYCGKSCETTKSHYNETQNHFCSNKCADKFRSENHRIDLKCPICGKFFNVTLSEAKTRLCCSRECQAKWYSENMTGENNPNFSSKLVKCEWCGKEHYQKQYKINNQDHFFCSVQCRQKWFTNVWSQTEKWKNISRIRATKMLSDGIFNHTDTGIQVIINKLLDNAKINYINEYNCKYVSIDNYLNKYNLMIECMGQYWHTDNRKYKKINYVMQRKRITKDKAKHTYIKNNYNIEILYLWEKDIIDNIELCKQLVLLYVKNKGNLENYHSFNYYLDKNNIIQLNTNKIIVPYMNWDVNKLNKIVDLSVKEKLSRKQEDKWIIYNCEYCGKKCEELISHHNKNKTHCCSNECAGKLNSLKHSMKVVCDNCGKDLIIN